MDIGPTVFIHQLTQKMGLIVVIHRELIKIGLRQLTLTVSDFFIKISVGLQTLLASFRNIHESCMKLFKKHSDYIGLLVFCLPKHRVQCRTFQHQNKLTYPTHIAQKTLPGDGNYAQNYKPILNVGLLFISSLWMATIRPILWVSWWMNTVWGLYPSWKCQTFRDLQGRNIRDFFKIHGDFWNTL